VRIAHLWKLKYREWKKGKAVNTMKTIVAGRRKR
jgi:hypothetical protein